MEKIKMKKIKFSISIIAICIFIFSSCKDNNGVNATNNGTNGTAGSLTRFILVENYLYTVDQTTLKVFEVDKTNTKFLNSISVGFNIETVFARENTLFLGSSTGIHIFDISNRKVPIHLSIYEHIYSCDPVVANQNYAFATLSTERIRCSRGVNRMDIIDISNLSKPKAVKSLTLSYPEGLGIVSPERLVVCDIGFKLYDISNSKDPKLIDNLTSDYPYDIIPNNGDFIAVAKNSIMNLSIANDKLSIIGKLKY